MDYHPLRTDRQLLGSLRILESHKNLFTFDHNVSATADTLLFALDVLGTES